MVTAATRPVVHFPDDYDRQSAHETPCKGYLTDVVVQLEDGSRYSVSFWDPVRLSQDLDELTRLGQPFFAEPNLIVLPEVTKEAVRQAVERLAGQGYFNRLKPLAQG